MNDKGEIPAGEKSSVGQTGQSARCSGDACQNSLVRWGIRDVCLVILVIMLYSDTFLGDESMNHVIEHHF